MRAIVLGLFAAAVSLAPDARAYTPESGLWANVNEPGSGMSIEIQDNLLGLTLYAGDAFGRPIFYTSAGLLTGNALYQGRLIRYDNIQCIGCPPAGGPLEYDDVGQVTIAFDPNDNTRATLTWPNGRQIPIQRFEFYYKRPEDPASIPAQATKMLGEWQVSIDLADYPGSTYPFSGDVLVLDDYEWSNQSSSWLYTGCRPDDAQVGGCSNFALANHAAAGFFEAPTGWQVIVVWDGVYDGQPWNVLYEFKIGTESGSGWFTLYRDGTPPENYDAYPARAWRSASRTFVQEGEGPSKAASTRQPQGLGRVLLAADVPVPKARSTRPETAARADIIRALEAQLRGKR